MQRYLERAATSIYDLGHQLPPFVSLPARRQSPASQLEGVFHPVACTLIERFVCHPRLLASDLKYRLEPAEGDNKCVAGRPRLQKSSRLIDALDLEDYCYHDEGLALRVPHFNDNLLGGAAGEGIAGQRGFH